jgi:hypothetical protein
MSNSNSYIAFRAMVQAARSIQSKNIEHASIAKQYMTAMTTNGTHHHGIFLFEKAKQKENTLMLSRQGVYCMISRGRQMVA